MDDELSRLRTRNAELLEVNAQLGQALAAAGAGSAPDSTTTAAVGIAAHRRAREAAEAKVVGLEIEVAELRTRCASVEALGAEHSATIDRLWVELHQALGETSAVREERDGLLVERDALQARAAALGGRVAVRVALAAADLAAPVWQRVAGRSRNGR